ncbi:DUF2069 domain-containing protein [Dokdonella sp.]|uniref:DUF2069 domain-containing protein n=1 Tax=Dokdonella sp. TaxID=2291710 RepID=UPI003C64775C
MTPIRSGFIAWAALILLQLLWHAYLAPPTNGRMGLALALTLTPLLLPLLALRRGPRRALLWVGIVSLGYFCHGIVAAWSIPALRTLALIEVVLSVALIGTLGWIARSGKSPFSK